MYDIKEWFANLGYMVKDWFAAFVDKVKANPVKVVLFLVVLFSIFFVYLAFAGYANASGGKNSAPVTSSSSASDASAFAEAHAVGGGANAGGNGLLVGGDGGGNQTSSQSQSVNTKAYGGGSTGLTSTAPCLGSFGILFNAVSATVADEGCIIRLYADKLCKDDACHLKMACLDPSLPDAAKEAIGCKQ